MRFTRFILLIIICMLSSLCMAKNRLVYYEPKVVNISGVIRTLKFPGPPNYESIQNGDADETGPYLILNKPIDIDLVPNVQIGNDELEKNVKLIQLAVHYDNDWPKVKEGNYVNITGTLFHALTWHHHARVLLMIEDIKVLSKQKIVNKKLNITNEDIQFLKSQYLQN